MAVEYECCETGFFIHILVIVFLVLFAGSMSGLTLGLMSLSLVDLEVLAKSGTPKDRVYAGTFICAFRVYFDLSFFGYFLLFFLYVTVRLVGRKFRENKGAVYYL